MSHSPIEPDPRTPPKRPHVPWEPLLKLPIRAPWLVISVFLALSATGGWVYFTDLEIVSSRRALTDRSLDFNQRWLDYRQSFDHQTNQLVLVATTPEVVAAGGTRADTIPSPPDPAQRDAMKRVADRWAAELRTRPDLFPTVRTRVDPEELGDYAILYAPFSAFPELVERVEELLPSLETVAARPDAATVVAEIRRLVSELRPPTDGDDNASSTAAPALRALEDFFVWFRNELETGQTDPEGASPEGAGTPDRAPASTTQADDGVQVVGNAAPEEGEETVALSTLLGTLDSGAVDPDGYLFVGQGRLLTAVAATEERTSDRNRYGPAMEHALAALRSARAEIPDSVALEVGLAGSPAVEYEEMLTSQRDFLRSSLLAFVLVSALFMLTYGSVLRPGLAAICLGMGIGMTFLVPWLLIGHLNVLAMVFVVILVALGVDFAIHFYTHYRRHLGTGERPDETILRTYGDIGTALWLAGLATALAFLSAYFTEFPGLSELGLVAGGGLLLTLVCMYFAFPAMLLLVDRKWTPPPLPKRSPTRVVHRWARPSGSTLSRVLVLAAGGASLLGIAFGEYRIDTNLLEAEPSAESWAGWQSLLLESEDRTTFALAVYADRGSLEEAREAFERSPVVNGTQAAFPGHEQEKRALLEPLCARVGGISLRTTGAPRVSDTRRELFGLRQTLRRYQRDSEAAREALARVDAEVGAAYLLLGSLDRPDAEAALARIDRRIETETARLLPSARGALCPPPLDVQAVPAPLRAGFVSDDGRLALRVYPARDTWRSENLAWFIEGARAVEPTVFGGVVNVHENARSMVRSFLQAASYSSIAVLALLLFWSRSLRTSLLAVFPVVGGVGLLLGAMRWAPLGLQWNVANLFAIPILIGVGIDGGIHLVRAWRLDPGAPFRGAMEAVLVSSLTTMTGFGILATGRHSGIASLGLLVFIGIGLNLVMCVTVLPGALRWLGEGPRLRERWPRQRAGIPGAPGGEE